MKRVVIIAVVLEWLKYSFVGLFVNLPEGFFSLVSGGGILPHALAPAGPVQAM